MIPRSVSASSLTNAQLCLALFKATNFERGTGGGSPPAQLGTALHAALEHFTEPDYLVTRAWEWSRLKEGFVKGWDLAFPGQPPAGPWWEDGLKILDGWYNRRDIASDILDVEVVSREVKHSFPVPYRIDGVKYEVPFNFIIDRLDRLDDGVYRVVDYKSQRSPLSPSDLHSKIQPRAYALAVQIQYPDAKEIWVQFDFLRYERVATVFSRADQVETWKHICKQVQRIVDTPDDAVPETLNESCRYCIRRFTCSTFQRNVSAGGIEALSIEQLADLHYRIKGQMDAAKQTIDDIEMALLRHAVEEDQTDFDLQDHKIKVMSKSRRSIDRERISMILGPDLMREYGRINVGDLDKLYADPRLNVAQKSLLDTAVTREQGEPTVKVMKKT
jgi:hypothetical protein